jgi:hypothetical protein
MDIYGVTGGTVILQIPEVSLLMDRGAFRNSPLKVTLLAFFEKYRKVMLWSECTSGELRAGGRWAKAATDNTIRMDKKYVLCFMILAVNYLKSNGTVSAT